jgi:hypothetical protein
MKEITIGPDCPLIPNMINIYMTFPPSINHIISINSDDTVIWKIQYHRERHSYKHYIISPSAKRTLYINMEEFLSDLKKIYPEDYEFFLWHPEAINGEWNQ